MDAKQFEEKDVFAFRDAGWYVVSSRMNPLGEGYRQVVTLERDVTKEMLEGVEENPPMTAAQEREQASNAELLPAEEADPQPSRPGTGGHKQEESVE